MPSKLYSIAEVSQLSGVAAHRINYGIRRGLIKASLSVNGRRGFTVGDLDRIREFFGVRVLPAVDPVAGEFTP